MNYFLLFKLKQMANCNLTLTNSGIISEDVTRKVIIEKCIIDFYIRISDKEFYPVYRYEEKNDCALKLWHKK